MQHVRRAGTRQAMAMQSTGKSRWAVRLILVHSFNYFACFFFLGGQHGASSAASTSTQHPASRLPGQGETASMRLPLPLIVCCGVGLRLTCLLVTGVGGLGFLLVIFESGSSAWPLACALVCVEASPAWGAGCSCCYSRCCRRPRMGSMMT